MGGLLVRVLCCGGSLVRNQRAGYEPACNDSHVPALFRGPAVAGTEPAPDQR